VGFSFGLTSGIITTLGLMVGLSSGTNSKLVVIGGILTIAIADAFSDSLGIHICEESENKHTSKEIWESTISTFFTKFIFSALFILPVLIFILEIAILVSVIFGFLVIAIISFKISKSEKFETWKVVSEHLVIAVIVVLLTHFVGGWIHSMFN
jgi:VIT1/CCC1 family predicted Fe2+/Mn2+ transporter